MTRREWQPIADAPRDGTWFVTANFDVSPAEYEVGCYDPMPWASYVDVGNGLYRREDTIVADWRGFDNFHRATHWARLPDTPTLNSVEG